MADFQLTPKQYEAKALIQAKKKYILLAGGSRSGKTAFLCYSIVRRALSKKSRHAILRFHFNDVKRSIGMDTLPKILDLVHASYTLNKSDWVFYIHRPDGQDSEIWLGGLDDKQRVEKILGNEYSTIYLNECSQISYHAYTTSLTRLAENSGLMNRVFIDCNPPEKSHYLYQIFVLGKQPDSDMPIFNPEQYGIVTMNPVDNPHLPKDYIDTLKTLPDRQKRRFLYGEWLDKRQGALFNADTINRHRVQDAPQYLPHIVCAIDPAVTSGEDSDETGIVVCAMDSTGNMYVIDDVSGKYTPAGWAEQVNKVCAQYEIDTVVVESNQGGDLLGYTIKTVNPRLVVQSVRATRGKVLRAEPVAALYETGKVHHAGYFPELEEQMVEWTAEDNYSPDRLDAMVWGMTYLLGKQRVYGDVSARPVNHSRTGSAYSQTSRTGSRTRPPVFSTGYRK